MKVLNDIRFSDNVLDVVASSGASQMPTAIIPANVCLTASGAGISIGKDVTPIQNGVVAQGAISGASVKTTNEGITQSLTVGSDDTNGANPAQVLVRSKNHYNYTPEGGGSSYVGPPENQVFLKCDSLKFMRPWGTASNNNGLDTDVEVSSGGIRFERHLHGASGVAWSGYFDGKGLSYHDESCGSFNISNYGMILGNPIDRGEGNPAGFLSATYSSSGASFSGYISICDRDSSGVNGIVSDTFDIVHAPSASCGNSRFIMYQYTDQTGTQTGSEFNLVISSGLVHDEDGASSGYVVFAVPISSCGT